MATLDSQGKEVGLDPTLVTQMEEEYREFVKQVVVMQHGSLRDLLSAPYTWARARARRVLRRRAPGQRRSPKCSSIPRSAAAS